MTPDGSQRHDTTGVTYRLAELADVEQLAHIRAASRGVGGRACGRGAPSSCKWNLHRATLSDFPAVLFNLRLSATLPEPRVDSRLPASGGPRTNALTLCGTRWQIRRSTSMRACIFCGEQASSKEDAWPPRWLTKRFLTSSELAHVEAERGGVSLGKWRASGGNIRVGCVCGACNNGWMSRLEEAASQVVAPLIESLFEQQKQEIDTRSLPTLAAWSVKTAMVLESFNPDLRPFYSTSERTQIRLTRTIPQGTFVWLAVCAEQKAIYAAAKHLAGRDRSPGLSGLATTMVFGPVAIQVLSYRVPAAIPADTKVTFELREGPWDEVLVPVWPIQGSPMWPPRQGLLGEIGLELLAERFSPGEAA
jgi:hypothetical protein